MVFSEIQQKIIKEVCSIQFQSLEDIFASPELKDEDKGIDYDLILEQHGCTRKHFDEELKKTYKKFQEIEKDPTKVLYLAEWDIKVFRHILYHWRSQWEREYPKALANLWDTLFIIGSINLG